MDIMPQMTSKRERNENLDDNTSAHALDRFIQTKGRQEICGRSGGPEQAAHFNRCSNGEERQGQSEPPLEKEQDAEI